MLVDSQLELPQPSNVAHALERAVHLKAAQDVLTDLDSSNRGWLTSEVKRIEDETGMAPSLKRKGLGSATLTDPEPKAVVVDREAFVGWLQDNRPGLVATVDRVEVIDHDAAADLYIRCTDKTGNRQDLNELARRALKVTSEAVIAEDTLDILHDELTVHVSDGVGVLVDDDGVPVPGVEVKAKASPTLQVRPDKKAREAIAADVLGRLRPALEGGDA